MGKGWFRNLLFCGAVFGPVLTGIAPLVHAEADCWGELQAVPEQELALMRGGYASAAGVEVSFGIEQAIFVDGVLQAVTSFNSLAEDVSLPDPRVMVVGGDFGQTAGLELVRTQLVVGSLDADVLRSQLVTVVQNSLDHKVIDSLTQLNAVVTSLEAFRQLRFFDGLQQQLTAARR